MFVEAPEHFKCDELTRAPCQSLPKFDTFDHFLKVKVAEIFWGAPAPLVMCMMLEVVIFLSNAWKMAS